jgi:predicted ATPase
MIRQLHLRNLLSFGPVAAPLALAPLNVLIGPNGAGKTNLLEVLDLLRHMPGDLHKPLRAGGGVQAWLWKGGQVTDPINPEAELSFVLANPPGRQNLRYRLGFSAADQRFELIDERIENEQAHEGYQEPYLFYNFNGGNPVLNIRGQSRTLQHEEIDLGRSILAQRRDPDQYPEITYLVDTLPRIRLYRSWQMGRNNPARVPQLTDLPNDQLAEDYSNLALVLNNLRKDLTIKRKLIDYLKLLYDDIEDFEVLFEGGTVQLFVQESHANIPAPRLSDGTLRYLALLAILCNPNPPPLIGIEEPEIGLHPDILPTVADLLQEASQRTQLIVTSHSDILVSALTDHPESVVVCEKSEAGTSFERLEQSSLEEWLEKYRLGDLWIQGELGGTRW